MLLTITDVDGVASDTFLSVRSGDFKRLKPFQTGESFNFSGALDEKGFVQFDVFKKLGSQMAQVSTSGSQMLNIQTSSGSTISAQLTVSPGESGATNGYPPGSGTAGRRQHVAVESKNYLDSHDVAGVVQGMLTNVLKQRPDDPINFMLNYLSNVQFQTTGSFSPPNRGAPRLSVVSPTQRASPDGQAPFSPDEPAAAEESGFPYEQCPAQMPNLSEHHSLAAGVLRGNPALYQQLRTRRTSCGVTFARCIKPGMDIVGHPLVQTIGAVAGDAECYTVFKELFDPLIQAKHVGYLPDSRHPTDLAPERISTTAIDPSGLYSVSCRIRVGRNLTGLRMPSACSSDERNDVERLVAKVLLPLEDPDLRGEYHPLRGSCSYAPKPGGMTEDVEKMLKKQMFLFTKPTSPALLSMGLGRDWPQGRGIFASQTREVVVWCNEEDHMRLVAMQLGSDLRAAFERLMRLLGAVEAKMGTEGTGFARSDHLGFLSTDLSNLGTGLRASVLLRIPRLSKHASFSSIVAERGLLASDTAAGAGQSDDGLREIANKGRLGKSEVELVNAVIEGAAHLVQLEQRLERGENLPDK
eukprot:gnl/TRDRNA2_/TRDRNA2_134031_c0_seq1.p1 gnl/TRDRNA2_/TRDRNA2_134031_c0~~gnl/TRDRNA2_/TRDRNA2_134031_c0_seq1.p1  ORF type:complete len:582 (-),score=90.82 gnl/TRDRNA2_/TRDRNA2_134031_c0_seq1:46-1791(-)